MAAPAAAGELLWPLDCVPGEDCSAQIGYPDPDNNGISFDCGKPNYAGHQGTDIGVSPVLATVGVDVYAAAPGTVLWVFDGRSDQCPSSHPDCQEPPANTTGPGKSRGYRVCTPLGPYCGDGTGGGQCYWCFDGGNVVVIRHEKSEGVFATRYDHLKKGSILVRQGDRVSAGQKIAEVGSAGHSSGPHLHFEVWGTGFYQLVDPWAGRCGTNQGPALWKESPPWKNVR